MKKFLFFIFLFTVFGMNLMFSQQKPILIKKDFKRGFKKDGKSFDIDANDTISRSKEINVILSGKTHYKDYKIISFKKDTVYIDTTLSIKKEYKFNFLRKDNFELLGFHNQGQTFTSLGYDFTSISQFPDIGFRAKQFFYYNVEDVKYYQVPTPTTEILYRTGLQQGQVLDAVFSLNFSKRLNVSFSYKGLRSLGHYRRSLSSVGNFRGAFHYKTKENQYAIRGHVTSQDALNQESGGLNAASLAFFIADDPDFENRGRLDVNLKDTETNFKGKRFYIEHDFKIISNKDTVSKKDFSNIKIGHIFSSEVKTNSFHQDVLTLFFGNASTSGVVDEEVSNMLTNNQVYVEFNSKYVLGKFRAKAGFASYSYGYDTIFNANLNDITKIELKGNAGSFGADWNAKIKNFQLNATATITPGNARLSGSHFKGEMLFKKDSLFTVKAHLLLNSKSPNFNFLLFQSTYDDYNWQNNFNKVKTRTIGGSFASKWVNASLDISNIDNYTYFDVDNKPKQTGTSITYLKATISNEFTFGKFALNNTVMYQNVPSGNAVFRVPELVTRNTIYYTDYWFKGKPLQVQIGTTFKYFTSYKANAYNPLLAEFTLQNTAEIGFPTVDVFFNMQVRRTRIYFKADNLSSFFLKKNYFSAPNYPYRDFVIRFGLVWNWFI